MQTPVGMATSGVDGVQSPVGMDTFRVHGVCADTCRCEYIWGG